LPSLSLSLSPRKIHFFVLSPQVPPSVNVVTPVLHPSRGAFQVVVVVS
jgi:hypothetical protein